MVGQAYGRWYRCDSHENAVGLAVRLVAVRLSEHSGEPPYLRVAMPAGLLLVAVHWH
jgi:hypothetical protein